MEAETSGVGNRLLVSIPGSLAQDAQTRLDRPAA